MKHRRIGGAITLVAILASPAPGQANDGLSLTIDGTTLAFLPQMDGGRTGFTRFLSVDAISIEGENGPARLVVELALPPGARNGDQPHDARISYRPDGWRDYWVSPLAFPPGAVVIEDLDLSGTAPRIAGRFALPLCFTASPVHTPDPNRCLATAGRFATPLVRD